MGILYSIETGVIGLDGNEYADEWIDSYEDREMAIESYIDKELSTLRAEQEMNTDLADGEYVYKRLTAELEDEGGHIENSVVIDYESEEAPHEPPLSCAADLGDIDSIIAAL